MTSTNKPNVSRRVLFRTLAGAATTVAAVTVPASIGEAYDPGPGETKARYRESEDVKAFYRSNGYES
jgi:hypothetical protein